MREGGRDVGDENTKHDNARQANGRREIDRYDNKNQIIN